jgi:DNA-binding NtrC family response regulator
VLVVDDEKLIRWSLSEGLTRRGCQVATAESGEQALELIATTRPEIALLDVRLPGIDGLATLRRALQLIPALVVVMMSAHCTVELVAEAKKLGAVGLLAKPFTISPLNQEIERAIATAIDRRPLVATATVSAATSRK